jgi:hypothetical protein
MQSITSNFIGFTAITNQTSHKKGRRAQPRHGFYIFRNLNDRQV